MTIRINFWRQGHANNSSSDHSLIWTPKVGTLEDSGTSEFGWSDFVCSSRGSKIRYMLCCLYSSYRDVTGIEAYGGIIDAGHVESFILDHFRKWACKNFPVLGTTRINNFSNHMGQGYVDHQSVITFPCHRDVSNHLNLGFAQDFITEIVDGDYAILGGNDNEDDPHPLAGLDDKDGNLLSKVHHLLKQGGRPKEILCEKDGKIGDYVLSSRSRGDIMRVTFIRKPAGPVSKPRKGRAIDINALAEKITEAT